MRRFNIKALEPGKGRPRGMVVHTESLKRGGLYLAHALQGQSFMHGLGCCYRFELLADSCGDFRLYTYKHASKLILTQYCTSARGFGSIPGLQAPITEFACYPWFPFSRCSIFPKVHKQADLLNWWLKNVPVGVSVRVNGCQSMWQPRDAMDTVAPCQPGLRPWIGQTGTDYGCMYGCATLPYTVTRVCLIDLSSLNLLQQISACPDLKHFVCNVHH